MATPRTALTSDDIPPGPLSEDDLRQQWNAQADEFNQWDSLETFEQLAWAQALAIKADRHAAALKAEPEGEGPSEKNLYDLAAEFNGDPVPAMRRALEVWGNPLQVAPAFAAPATPPAPEGNGSKTHPSQQQIDDLLAAISAAYSAQGWVPDADFICLFEEVARLAGIVEEGWDASVSPDDTKAKARAVLSRCGTPATPPSPEVAVPEPVAWCLSDEFENAMKRGGSFNGWKDPGAGANKCDMRLYAIPLPAPQAGEVEA
jgi:hypothetical protein